MPLNRQLSIFSADSTGPSTADLAGLLIGPGQLVRMGGTARVSIVVGDAWRVHVLVAELAERGLESTWEPAMVPGHYSVRTPYAGALTALAGQWMHGAGKCPPAHFNLGGSGLRLWFAAAGSIGDDAAELRLGPHDVHCPQPAMRALAALGLPGVLMRGPVLRITGRRRLSRLGELIGPKPDAAPRSGWPS